MLINGRNDKPGFDISKSPMAAFLLERGGPNNIKRLFESANATLKEGKYSEYLTEVRGIIGNDFTTIAQGLEEVALKGGYTNRADSIRAIADTTPDISRKPGVEPAEINASPALSSLLRATQLRGGGAGS